MPEPSVIDDHHLTAVRRDGDLLQLWCACGWTSRAGFPDCFDYLDRHLRMPTWEELFITAS
jgi:hypothetical protein